MRSEARIKELKAEDALTKEINAAIAEERKLLRAADMKSALEIAELPETPTLDAAHESGGRGKLVRKKSLAYLSEKLPEAAQLVIHAARVAAQKGDAKPAQWLLENVKPKGEDRPVVDPPQKEAPQSGVKILIGVNLGGIGTVGPVSASNEEKANEGLPAARGRVSDPRVIEATVVGGSGT